MINPPFKGPLLSGINLTLDYYKINIDNAILQTSVDNANFNCVGKSARDHRGGSAGPGGEPGVPAESERPGERRAAVDDHLVQQPGEDRHGRLRLCVELARVVRRLRLEAEGRIELQPAEHVPRLLQDEAVACDLRRRDGMEGLARSEPHRHAGRRVRLPLVPDVELLPRHLEREPALEGPAVGLERGLCEPTGDQGQQRGRGGGGHEQDRAGLRADDGDQDGLVSSVRPRVQLQLPCEDDAARRYHEPLEHGAA